MMLSGGRRIVSAGNVSIKDLSRVIDVGVCITVLDMAGRLDIVGTIERGAVTLAILIMTRWMTSDEPHGANLLIRKGKGARLKGTVTILSVGGETPLTMT